MFTAWCAKHGARVLLDPGAIEAIRHVPGGYEIRYRCGDGWRGRERIERHVPPPRMGLTPVAA